MKCSKCGKEIANDSNFCEYCGTKVPKAKSRKPLWIVLVLCIIGLFVGIIIYYENELDNYRYSYYDDDCCDTVAVFSDEEDCYDTAAVELEGQFAQVPGGEYRIVGTQKTHTMTHGESLDKIAKLEYGDKDFVQYIIVHNAFPDPDNVPVGTEIKLPILEEYYTDDYYAAEDTCACPVAE